MAVRVNVHVHIQGKKLPDVIEHLLGSGTHSRGQELTQDLQLNNSSPVPSPDPALVPSL